MRLTCSNCGVKYTISDDKVRGKVFRLKCKKCGQNIMVRDPSTDSEAEKGSDVAMAPLWYAVCDSQRVGPLDTDEIQRMITSGRLTADSLVWRDGFSSWSTLESTELASSMALSDGREEVCEPSHSPALFRDVAAEPASTESIFSQPMNDTHPRVTEEETNVVTGRRNLVGQRQEDSVLFSLSSLLSITADRATTESSGKPQDSSGLIDIKALAPVEMALSNKGDGSGEVFSNMVVHLPGMGQFGTRKRNKRLVIGISAAAMVAVFLLGALIYVLIDRRNQTPQPGHRETVQVESAEDIARLEMTEPSVERGNQQPDADNATKTDGYTPIIENAQGYTQVALLESELAAVKSHGTRTDSKPHNVKPKPNHGDSKPNNVKPNNGDSKPNNNDSKPNNGDSKPNHGDSKPNHGDSKPNNGDSEPIATDEPFIPDTPDSDPLEGLVEGNSQPKDVNQDLPNKPNRRQVKKTITSYNQEIGRCYSDQSEPRKGGTIKVKFIIGRDGRVTSAHIVSPEFKNTAVGACVLGVVGDMQFERFSGDPVTVNYPFILQ